MTVAAIIAQSRQEREAWRYTDLSGLAALGLAPALRPAVAVKSAQLPSVMPVPQRHRLVFVDGAFDENLSQLRGLPKGLLQGNAAAGYTLTLPDQLCLAIAPLELLFVATKDASPRESCATLRLNLGENARLTLIEQHLSLGAGAAHAARTNCAITLDAKAKLLHAKFQAMGEADYHLAQRLVTVAAGAYYHGFTLTTGAALSRDEIAVTLVEDEAQARLDGLYLQRGAQHADTHITMTHAAPHCTSRQLYKGVLDGKARGVFQGKIIVAPQAQKTDGHQLSRALLLSEQAEANAKPELEIYADDVKCSHGATVGALDDMALFYLRARGIPEQQARSMLVQAFASEIVDALGFAECQRHALAVIQGWMMERP